MNPLSPITSNLPPMIAPRPSSPNRKSIRVFLHDYDKIRMDAAKRGTTPLLRFKDGADTILLPTGQQVRKDPKPKGKSARRERIRQRRLAREASQ